MGEDGKEEEG